jgi:hypothetical protein
VTKVMMAQVFRSFQEIQLLESNNFKPELGEEEQEEAEQETEGMQQRNN